VIENQFIGVKCLPWKRLDERVAKGLTRAQLTFAAVNTVADQGMP
jgi:hypothetical protein